jgi:hypothetical protein
LQTFFMPLLVSAMFSGGGINGVGGGGGGGCHSGGDDGKGGGGGAASSQHSSLMALASAVPFMLATLGMNINARLASRANERHRHAGVPILAAGVALGLVPMAARVAGSGLAFALLTLAAGLCWTFHGEPAPRVGRQDAAPFCRTGAGCAFLRLLVAPPTICYCTACGFPHSPCPAHSSAQLLPPPPPPAPGPFFSWPAVFLGGEQAAAGFAFINSVGAVGGFIGPYLLGLLGGGGGFGTAMLVLACFLLVAGCLILLFPAPGHRDEACVTVLQGSDSAEYTLASSGGSAGQQLGGGSSEVDLAELEAQRPSALQQQAARHARRKSGSSSELECQPILSEDGGIHAHAR